MSAAALANAFPEGPNLENFRDRPPGLTFSSEIETNDIFKRDCKFQASRPPTPYFCGLFSRSRLDISSKIEVLQARLEISSGNLKFLSVQARLIFFRIRALWVSAELEKTGNNYSRWGAASKNKPTLGKPQTGSFVTGSFRQALATRSSSARQTLVSIVFVFAIARQTLAKRLSKTTRLESYMALTPPGGHAWVKNLKKSPVSQ